MTVFLETLNTKTGRASGFLQLLMKKGLNPFCFTKIHPIDISL